MNIFNVFTNSSDTFPDGKADLLLASSIDQTTNDKELLFTPTLNAEFITHEKIFSLEISQAEDTVSTSAIIARAIHNLNPFSSIEVLDLGLNVKPQNTICHDLHISSSDSIKDIFEKGMILGRSYELKGNYLILAINSTLEQTNVMNSVLALDFESQNSKLSNFDKLSVINNPILFFYAGFLLEASRRFHIVLSGGLDMAICLFIADKVREDILMRVKHDNITLSTTEWDIKNENTDITELLSQLSYTPHALYTSFDFSNSEIQALREYANNLENINIGIGAFLAYGITNSLEEEAILNEIEIVSYSL